MQALQGAGDGRAETEGRLGREAEVAAANASVDAEDRFHLRAKRRGGFDPLTGLVSREEEPVLPEEELPEDRFHKDDALSAHYISQREGDREDKWTKHEKEKQDRLARKARGEAAGIDENIEYIEVEDFKPGGRYGPPAVDVAAKRDELTGVRYSATDEMLRASKAMLEAVVATHPSPVLDQGLAEVGESHKLTKLTELQSTVWADLLD